MQTPVTAIQALKIARQESKRAMAMSPQRAGLIQIAIGALNDAIRLEENDPAQPAATRSQAQAEPDASTHHRCAAIACHQIVIRHQAFCRPHWFALTADLQKRILETYSAWTDGMDSVSHQYYMAAMKEAIIYLRDNPPRQRRQRA